MRAPKGVDGFKKCTECSKRFPYRSTLKVRSTYSPSLKMWIGSVNQVFCSRPCSLRCRNRLDNPSKSSTARAKISAFAKTRGTACLNSAESKEKQAKSISGAGHWNWQGGKTAENKRRRNLAEYQNWRMAVFRRDDYTCTLCGARNRAGRGETVRLNADHIKPWSLFPELRLELSNGRTLCLACHKKTDTYMGRIKHYAAGTDKWSCK